MSTTALMFLSLSFCVAGHSLLVHYSRTQPGPKYSSSTVVLFTEVLKFIGGLLMILWDKEWNFKSFLQTLYIGIIANYLEFLKTSIPSLIYAFQNNLVIISLANLDAATFQLTSQLKILWTAFFMWRMLRRRFSSQRCLALMLLCVGEILVHYDLSTPAPTLSSSNTTVFECISEVHPDPTVNDVESKNILHDREFLQQCVSSPVATTNSRIHQSHALGLMAALGTCIGSGFAGVYLELILKTSTVCSFWVRNTQLYLSGIIINAVITIASHWNQQMSDNIFHGFNEIAVLISIMSALVGFFTAFVIQRLDNIWKNLASSAAVVIATLGSVILFGTPIGMIGLIGTLVVVLVPWLYHTG